MAHAWRQLFPRPLGGRFATGRSSKWRTPGGSYFLDLWEDGSRRGGRVNGARLAAAISSTAGRGRPRRPSVVDLPAMCGIVSVVRPAGARVAPPADQVTGPLHAAVDALASGLPLTEACNLAAERLEAGDALLRGTDGVWALVHDRRLLADVEGLAAQLDDTVEAIEARLDAGAGASGDRDPLEAVNAAVVRLKDAVWSIERDRVRTTRAVAELAGSEPGWPATEAYPSIQQALSAIDRVEVRGRDSAGLHVLVRGHGLALASPAVTRMLADRAGDPLFRSGTVRVVDGCLSFVYKAAAEIGELGDNTRALRDAVRSDELLRLAVSADTALAVVLGHTRWASVGMISQPNAHPVDSTEADIRAGAEAGVPYVVAALNGDVDNFADLKALDELQIAPEITTDAKVIPTLVARRLAEGNDLTTAFRNTVASFEGSVAIAASASAEPDKLLLALRGSGQALYVALADGAYIVASEPYGVIELTGRYVRMDGETPANPDNPTASRGQIVVLDGSRAGTLDGIERLAYDGTPLPVSEADVGMAQITTRDIDRGPFPHFLLKEISEAPASFRKTLRGKLIEVGGDGVGNGAPHGDLAVALGPDVLPADVRAGLRSGDIDRVVVVGQGTAAVAGEAMAAGVEQFCGSARDRTDVRSWPERPAASRVTGQQRKSGRHVLKVEALPATELSGFGLRPSMSDTLVVAISQSGTTTDTNRTVDLVRARVAQVVLRALRELPDAMAEVIERRPVIAEAAHRLAPAKRYWAVVGNGVNRIAAAEVRIKLSELCYKSIAADSTEDKKHIDLSAEPLIVVCAAGLQGSTADDVAKEVAIYRAHKASPVVIATDGQARFASALHVLPVPATHPALAFVLSAMAGHLFGYEAALAIDALARPLRAARAAIEAATVGADGATGAPTATARDGEAVLRPLRAEPQPGGRG